MTCMLTCLMRDRFDWRWKPTSLEVLLVNLEADVGNKTVQAGDVQLTFAIKDQIDVLGGVLARNGTNAALIEHRLRKGENAFYVHSMSTCPNSEAKLPYH